MTEKKKQVNVDFTKFPELLDDLDKMVDDEGSDRSKFIRKLVKEEKVRRDSSTRKTYRQVIDSRKRVVDTVSLAL